MGHSRAGTPPPTCTTHSTENNPAKQEPHHPHTSPNRTCGGVHCPWGDNYDILQVIRHLVAALTPHQHTHQQPPDPQEPDHHIQPRPMSPNDTEHLHEEQLLRGPEGTPTPPPLQLPKDIYATLASTLAQAMDAEQYY